MAAGMIVKIPPAKAKRSKRKQKSVASKALALAKENKKMINKTIENKQINYDNVDLAVSSAGVVDNSFLKVTQGAGDGDAQSSTARIGNSVTLMRQQYCFSLDGLNPDTLLHDRWNHFRIIIAEPLDGNQALTLADVLQYPVYADSGTLVFSSPYTTKTSTNRRYKIHYDRSFELNATAKGATRTIRKLVKWGKTGKVVNFDGNSASPTDHNMSILFISDSGTLPHPNVSYSVRSTYKDA